jgi:type IV pilus assembly protein PilO
MALNLNKLPWYAQVTFFVVLSVAGAAAFFYLYVTPAQTDMAVRQRQLDALRVEITKGQAVARRLPEFRSQVGDLEARLERLKAILPEEKDAAEILRRIQTLAVQSSLEVKRFKPTATVTKQLHAEVPYTVEIEGGYHNLGLFFDRVSKFPRLINISDISIKGKDKQEPNSTITAEFVATTFVLLATPPPKTATPAAPGQPAPAKPPGSTGGAQ